MNIFVYTLSHPDRQQPYCKTFCEECATIYIDAHALTVDYKIPTKHALACLAG
jgi:hypothetical protein